MAKSDAYRCTSCGATSSKWAGRCETCGEWNTLEAEAPLSGQPKLARAAASGTPVQLYDLGDVASEPKRTTSGVQELDRALGGGLVDGAAMLLGGDPGIGKSTLLLQAAARYARNGLSVIYISGEESRAQVQLRAQRLGLTESPVKLASSGDLNNILATLEREKPDLAIIDSIQTMWSDAANGAPGSLSQVRHAAHALTTLAKTRGTAVMMVGHVTKDGAIAGPRVVEHMVDTVLYFEGERGHSYRILRAVKNRFGALDEIGVFEMTGRGLVEVRNPSQLFLAERDSPAPGSVVFPGNEGSRILLCELQALVAPSPTGQPRRSVVGIDSARLSMVLAVLDARAGVSFAGYDVYLNVAGGLRIHEPAADLALAAALLSAKLELPLPADSAVFGEISLSGAIRSVNQAENRLKEAQKLGFSSAIFPLTRKPVGDSELQQTQFGDITAFTRDVFLARMAEGDG